MHFIKKYIFIIKNNLYNLLILFIGINFISLLSVSTVFNTHIEYLNNQIKNNISEYNEIDREQLCKITGCSRVDIDYLKKSFIPNDNGVLCKAEYIEDKKIKIHNNLFLTKNFKFSIYSDVSRTFFVLDTSELILDYINMLSIFITLITIFFLFSLARSINDEKDRSLLSIANNEVLLANNTMINITENIHHELNTPLEVIDNKTEKINRVLANFLIEEHKATKNLRNIPKDRVERNAKLASLSDDFDFVRTASEQIYSVLNKMKNFKQIRYSNGNKSIRDIIEGGFNIINISNTNFDYLIDYNLDKYVIGSEAIKNADLLSIILNHIKNSLEAGANKIYIVFVLETKKIIKFRIIDNGKGIPVYMQKNLFKPNFSTKSNESGIRGNGMYLNKYILNTVGGDVSLISTSYKGTTIEISIPAKLK